MSAVEEHSITCSRGHGTIVEHLASTIVTACSCRDNCPLQMLPFQCQVLTNASKFSPISVTSCHSNEGNVRVMRALLRWGNTLTWSLCLELCCSVITLYVTQHRQHRLMMMQLRYELCDIRIQILSPAPLRISSTAACLPGFAAAYTSLLLCSQSPPAAPLL